MKLDNDTIKAELSTDKLINHKFNDNTEHGLKYAEFSLYRSLWGKPSHEYVWFGEKTEHSVTETRHYCYLTDDGEGVDVETITAPLLISHAEMSRDLKTGVWCVCHLAVHTDFKNQGYAKKLIQDIITFCNENDIKSIEHTFYSKEGSLYLKNNFEAALQNAGISFVEYK